MYLFLVHTLLLTGASLAAARRLVAGLVDRSLAAALLFWGNLVVTSLLLSGLHRLGHPDWFFRVSALLAVVTWVGLRRVIPEPAPAPAADEGDRFSRLLLAAFVLTLGPIVFASVWIASTYVPNNYDSMSYHLPRVMFYLGQDTLAHFSTGNDRQIYFPFNFNLLQLFGLIYSPPLQTLNFINLAAWGVAGLAIYRLSRLGAASANAALIATWLALTSTQILAQATATTNDLPTGAGLLCTLVFLLRWRQARRTRDALLAGLAAGLTLGSKLTIIFFAPAAGLLVLLLAWQHWRRGAWRGFFQGVRAWIAPGALALALASPFALINLAEKGQWLNQTYDYTLNRPFSTACVLQTAKAYLIQLWLEPLHRFSFDLKLTERLNTWGEHTFFPHWNKAYAFSPLYLFPPDLNEDHVWFGLTGPFLLCCAAFCLVRWRRQSTPMIWLAWLGLGWFATYFVLNKWSLYNQRYFVLPLLVLSPCLAAGVGAGLAHSAFRRSTTALLAVLGLAALWLSGVYLFSNTSRPFAPLWAGEPPPPALPKLPPLIARRLQEQPLINFDSTDGNERAFLFMTRGDHQRFIASNRGQPGYYTIFSLWGFPRKVAYSNIEQPSSYTVVPFATKRTAGVEFLATIGKGQESLDYYGLVPHADQNPATDRDRNVLVMLYYKPHDPGRYAHMRVRVAGLNPPDQAKLTLGVEYEDRSRENLATFDATGETFVSVTKPFRRFLIQVDDLASGEKLGEVDLPYLNRNLPPEVEAPDDPLVLFADELVVPQPESLVSTTGLTPAEGPYPQWNLPVIRWAKAPVVRLEIPAREHLARVQLTFRVCLQSRASGHLDVRWNGQLVRDLALEGKTHWETITLPLTPIAGPNVLEFRNVVVGTEPDWLAYLEDYPDVKSYLVAAKLPLEKGARDHYELFGKAEHRVVHVQRHSETLADATQLYYLFSTIRLDGFRNP